MSKLLQDLTRQLDSNGIDSYQKTRLFAINQEDSEKVRKFLKEKKIAFKQFESSYIFEREFLAEDAIRDTLAKNGRNESAVELLSIVHRVPLARELTPCSNYDTALEKASEYIEKNKDKFTLDMKKYLNPDAKAE